MDRTRDTCQYLTQTDDLAWIITFHHRLASKTCKKMFPVMTAATGRAAETLERDDGEELRVLLYFIYYCSVYPVPCHLPPVSTVANDGAPDKDRNSPC